MVNAGRQRVAEDKVFQGRVTALRLLHLWGRLARHVFRVSGVFLSSFCFETKFSPKNNINQYFSYFFFLERCVWSRHESHWEWFAKCNLVTFRPVFRKLLVTGIQKSIKVRTCWSVRPSSSAKSPRSAAVRYRWVSYLFSKSSICFWVKAVLAFFFRCKIGASKFSKLESKNETSR